MQYSNTIARTLMLSAFIALGSSAAWAQNTQDIPLLFVENDEKSLEVQVQKFLDERTNWPVELAYFGEGRTDAYVLIPFTLDDGRSVNIYVDSFSSADAGRERRLHVYGYFILENTLGTRKRAALLEVLNQHTIDDWMSQRLYLDKDGDIAFAWVINVPGKDSPIHAEQVYDAIIRTKFSLNALLPKLRPLGLP